MKTKSKPRACPLVRSSLFAVYLFLFGAICALAQGLLTPPGAPMPNDGRAATATSPRANPELIDRHSTAAGKLGRKMNSLELKSPRLMLSLKRPRNTKP